MVASLISKIQRYLSLLPVCCSWISDCVAIVLLLVLLAGCGWFSDPEKTELIKEASLDLPKIPYKTEMKGEVIPELEAHLKAVSLLIRLEARPPTSLNALYHRARHDKTRLKQALADKGYFDAQVKFSVVEDKKPVMVTVTIILGTRYKISGIKVTAAAAPAGALPLIPGKVSKAIQLHVGEQVDLTHVQAANQRVLKYLRDHGYPYAEMAEPAGQIDRRSKRLNLIFRAVPGPYLPFGKTNITGLKDVDSQFVVNRVVWQEGNRYNERDLEKTRQKLMGTGLFSGIEIKPQENGQAEETVPISIHLTEGPPRTIGAGLKYATTEGLGGQIFWSHRNTFGKGEGLGLSVRRSRLLSRAKIDFDIPDIFAPEQYLRNEVSVTRERNRAYQNQSFEMGTRLEHPFTETITGMVGVTAEAGQVRRAGLTYVNRLVGLPLEMKIDESNSLLEPTKGGRLSAQITPYMGQSGRDHRLTIATLKGSYYLSLDSAHHAVVAAWAHGGTIVTRSLDNIAPNKRFYAGGAGSVRPYGYKLLGPLDHNRVPSGGRSILEYGIEGRFKMTDTLGFVAFVEAGSLSPRPSPDMSSQTRLWGLGVGARYYTDIGPIRFDIATPMKRRRDASGKAIDSSYQFYLSIGQAF